MWARTLNPSRLRVAPRRLSTAYRTGARTIHITPAAFAVRPFVLADIGEGIRECEVIQWFVQPGARVEQFDKLCEVQSDKASVEITSRFDGVIKKLHYETGEMALVGKPLVDIDTEGEPDDVEAAAVEVAADTVLSPAPQHPSASAPDASSIPTPHRFSTLATPAVRRICKELQVDITHVSGSGKDGRVLKEDVAAFREGTSSSIAPPAPPAPSAPSPSGALPAATPFVPPPVLGNETTVPLTPIQAQMFKAMTKSLSIPHFLFSDEVHLDPLLDVRARINADLASAPPAAAASLPTKLSYLPFIIKAISLALNEYPIINSRVSTTEPGGDRPAVVLRSSHNIGVAMDTPTGLIVPNIKNVQTLSIFDIARELSRLQAAASAGKLTPADIKGGTITVSNIGGIGGRVVSPVIVSSEVAILGIGKAKKVPAFDEKGQVVAKTELVCSWSADHRVIDGATMARMATLVKTFVEKPELMLARLR
ncbi:2-oxoacid dehydrogenases acyltransferase-domain-containing protein [Peziza echinospora]|nr:2-oxoacid dehydrogenases acyltransferase-domain-containing protein [Peziza echinospora]